MSNIKESLIKIGFKESKKNQFSKVYKHNNDKIAIVYKFTPTKMKYYYVDSSGAGTLLYIVPISSIFVNEDSTLELNNLKEYKGKEKHKRYNFSKL